MVRETTVHTATGTAVSGARREGSFLESFLAPLAFLGATLLAICANFRDNTVTFLGVAAVFLATLAWRPGRFAWIVAALALPFGTFGEWFCCRNDLWVYANPTWEGLPAWLPMVWPILMVAFIRMAGWLDRRATARLSPGGARLLALGMAAAAIAYAVVTFVTIHAVIATVFAAFLVLMLLFARSRYHWTLFWTAAFCGSLGEIVCMRFGVWHYTTPVFRELGIPLSLPLAWGLSANILWMAAGLFAGRAAGREA